MMKVITNRRLIAKAHVQLSKQMASSLVEIIECRFGFHGGSFNDKVKYSQVLNIWMYQYKHKTRYWNGFGVGRPIQGKSNSITGEINFPYEGIDRRISGVFAEKDGNIFILHRGIIGGGKKGVGKSAFLKNYAGTFVIANDNGRDAQFCLIGQLGSDQLPHQIARFIKEIQRIKTYISSGSTSSIEHEIYNNYRNYVLNHAKQIGYLSKFTQGQPFLWLAEQLNNNKAEPKSIDFIIAKVLNKKEHLINYHKVDVIKFYVIGTFKEVFTPSMKVAEMLADFYLELRVLPDIVIVSKKEFLNDVKYFIEKIRNGVIIYDRERSLY